MKIAISRGDNSGSYALYENWLKKIDPSIECVNLYGLSIKEAFKILGSCSGILLSGGNDISPDLYGKSNQIESCLNIDKLRDELEISIINKTIQIKLPVLAICRGQQILNVAMGGTLICDIEKDIKTNINHKLDGIEKNFCFHNITLKNTSLINKIYNSDNAIVNSYHHQAIDRIADCFKVTAYSEDNIIEAIEWKDPSMRSFLLGVQWHPERMNADDISSVSIAKTFIDASRSFQNQN